MRPPWHSSNAAASCSHPAISPTPRRTSTRVVGFDDPAITAAALLGLGEAHYRLDDEPAASRPGSAVLSLPETPSTYPAWRNIAAARVREGDLNGAIAAYREADRRAPAGGQGRDREPPRLAEQGDRQHARLAALLRPGPRRRPRVTLTLLIIAVTSIVSLTALFSNDGQALFDLLQLDKPAVADGEYWRLWTVTLLHGDLLHLLFNMYALYLAGPIVERWYGSLRFVAFYLACAAAGSTASFVFGGDIPSVGASGRRSSACSGSCSPPADPPPGRSRRAAASSAQLGVLILINIVFGFASGGSIDNAAHLGGLAAGVWLGALVPPTGSRRCPRSGSDRATGVRCRSRRRRRRGTSLIPWVGRRRLIVAAGVAVGTKRPG